MSALSGPVVAAAVLLLVGGTAKLRRPAPLVRALRAAGLPARPALARVAAAVELAIGAWVLSAGGRAALALAAAAYAAFTAFTVRALRGGAPVGCGCFGGDDVPPTRLHAVLTAVLGACALASAVAPAGTALSVLVHRAPPAAAVAVAGALACAWLLHAALTLLPRLAVDRPRAGSRPGVFRTGGVTS